MINDKACFEGVSSCDGVCGGWADKALLSFSIVGQAEGEGMISEGYRLRLVRASFLTEADACNGTSASSSVTSYSESKSLSALLAR